MKSFFSAAAFMSSKMHVNKPILRKSSLSLNKINGSIGGIRKNSAGGSGSTAAAAVASSEAGSPDNNNAFDDLRAYVKQVERTRHTIRKAHLSLMPLFRHYTTVNKR